MLGEKKFLNSIYYENLTGKTEEKKIGKCNNGKIEFAAIKMNNLPVREHYGDEAFITKPLEKDGITCCAGTVGKIENNCFIPNDNFRLKYDELSTKTGYVMVDGSTLRIGTHGNIEYKSPEYFLECPKTSYVSGSNLLIIEKKERENVKKVLEEIEHEIQENNKKNIVLRNRTLSVEKSIIKSLVEKFESKTINSVLLIIHKDKFPLIKFNYTMPSNDKYFLYKEDVKNLEIYITNETIIKEKISQNAYTDLLMRLNKNKVLYTKCLNKDFSELYKKKLPDMVTGLKVIYDGKEITQETRNTIGNVGAFQCRPYLFLDGGYVGKYKFPFTNKDKKAVFTKRRIIDYARAETKTMKGVLIFSGTGVHFENGNRYDTAPLLIESKEKELLNISEFINKEIDDEKYYACKFNNGNGFIKGKDLKVRLEIEKTDSLIGSSIDQNTFLGYRRKDKPYLDRSTFFYDNLLEIKPEKIQLVIPGGAPCVKIEKRQKKLFLSNNTCIKTSKVKDNSNFAKLEEVKVTVTIYKSDNEDCIEIHKDSLKCKDYIHEIWFWYHSYIFEKEAETNKIKLTGGNQFEKYTQSPVSTETEEVKIYAEKLILPKILNTTHKWKHIVQKQGHVDYDSYQFTIKITPAEIAQAYDFTSPLYIDTASIRMKIDNSKNYDKGQIVTVYTDEENETPVTLPYNSDGSPFYRTDNYIKTQEDLIIEKDGITYKIKKDQLEQYGKNILKDYIDSLKPLNYKYGSFVQIADEKLCPTDSLCCNVRDLKEKLKEAEDGKYSEFLDYDENGIGSNRIYKTDAYKPALEAGIQRFIALHPLEFDKELHTELTKKVLPHLKIEEFSDERDNDIAGNIASEEVKKSGIKENKFYFVYPPLLDKAIEESRIREFNPYEKYGKAPAEFEMKNNPGFIPTDNFTYSQSFNHYHSPSYSHEGVDLAIERSKCGKVPIMSGISGRVIFEGDKGNYSYGCFIIIQADEKYNGKYRYYLLAHLDRDAYHKHEGETVTPDETVGYVGNTGHCTTTQVNGGMTDMKGEHNAQYRPAGYGAHLHLQLYLRSENNSDFIKDMNLKYLRNNSQSIVYINVGIVNPFNYEETYILDGKK